MPTNSKSSIGKPNDVPQITYRAPLGVTVAQAVRMGLRLERGPGRTNWYVTRGRNDLLRRPEKVLHAHKHITQAFGVLRLIAEAIEAA